MDNLTIGIFGGSFNPITTGHVRVASAALNLVNQNTHNAILSEVWFMPCAGHTFNKNLLPWENRLEMLNIVVKSSGAFRVCDYEIKNSSTGSAYETLNTFRDKFFGLPLDFYYIIGSDNTQSMEKWVNWEKLIEEFKFIIMPRPGYCVADWAKEPQHQILPDNLFDKNDISSSSVRNFIAQKEYAKARRLVYPAVSDYIEENKLYRGVEDGGKNGLCHRNE